ncbi:MAG: substrate-binding domain-containing protein [Prevotella sp.]|nr:substrate-binding domain-containing protein [Prevotella sp.]
MEGELKKKYKNIGYERLWLRVICALVFVLLVSCSRNEKKYLIGVSQCSSDIWRNKLIAEIETANYSHDDVALSIVSANDDDQRQIAQIDSLISVGVDLLIVSPNQVSTISPAIDRAFQKGIKVILFDRKTDSPNYTAFMGADNYAVGHAMGEYAADRLDGRGIVLEIMGLRGSSPAIDRHRGFAEALAQYPDIRLMASLQGDWTEESGYKAMSDYLKRHPEAQFHCIFGQNDRMALGARKAFIEAGKSEHLPLFCGIDALSSPNGGIEQILSGNLEASYIYPTRGDELFQLAMNILEGKPYERENQLKAAIVTRDNANVMLMQAEEMERQSHNIEEIHSRVSEYVQRLANQRILTGMAIGIIVLLVVVIVLFYLYHLRKIALQRERVVNTLWNLKPEDVPAVPEAHVASETAEDTENSDQENEDEPVPVSHFITRFKEVIEARLEDSDVSVEDLAADMNLSRVQLYRKVKSLSGRSPVELLRTARLNRAYQLLLSSDKSVSEVAYAVGFSAPSYFTKCFRDEFGVSPSEVSNETA